MKKYYRDFYGCTASITKVEDGFRLRVSLPNGRCRMSKVYSTERGARIAMGRLSDSWEVKVTA